MPFKGNILHGEPKKIFRSTSFFLSRTYYFFLASTTEISILTSA